MSHIHSIYDTDPHFTIDPVTRRITNMSGKTTIVQGDHNSERFTFEIPRFVDGHDMSLCDVVEIHYDNIASSGKETYSDVVEVDDLQVSPASTDVVIFSWLLTGNATQHKGALNFSIGFQCTDSDGNVDYELGTLIHEGITIGERIRNSKKVFERVADILSKWRANLFGIGDTEEASMRAVSQEQQNAIAGKGAEVLATIPEDYSTTSAMAKEAMRTKADGIVLTADGETVAVNDASNNYIRGLRVFGKSTQKNTTGKNLFDNSRTNLKLIDKTVTPHYGYEVHLPAGTYTVSATRYIDTYLYVSVYYKGVMGEALCVVLPTETRTATVTLNDGDVLVLYNAIVYTSDLGNESATNNAFITCQVQVERGDTASAYEPYSAGIASPSPEYPQEIVSVEKPSIRVCNKNVLNNQATDKGANGITFSVNEDKSVTVNGTSSVSAFLNLDMNSPIGFGGNELIASLGGGNDTVYMSVGFFDADGHITDCVVRVGATEKKFVYPVNAVKMRVYMFVNAGTTYNNVTVYPMIRLASNNDSTYEPYCGQSFDINYIVSGIPVTSGGNYTDANGQQWICDEVDFERGMYVQRIFQCALDGRTNVVVKNDNKSGSYLYYHKPANEQQKLGGYCTHFKHTNTYPELNHGIFNVTKSHAIMLSGKGIVSNDNSIGDGQTEFNDWLYAQYESGNPVVVSYILSTPIETPLQADELAGFHVLRTNYPNTTVLNDAGAHVQLKYLADTKTYVDNQITKRIAELTNT